MWKFKRQSEKEERVEEGKARIFLLASEERH